ncbi:acid protease [Xylaria castorea]|nr:acid protease [Xylaria castorea]
MLLSNSVVWRVFALLGALFLALATEAVAFPSSNATYTAGATAVDSTSSLKHSGQVLTIPLKRVNHRGIATPSIAKRFFKTEVFGVYGAAYLAELTIGNSTSGNQQVVNVLIDTGSFELWVNPTCSTSNVPEFCEAFGHYDPALSPTSQKLNNNGFSIKYGSGQVRGPYYKDDIYISGARIQNQQFGVANSSELVWFGIMGLGHGQGNGFINYPLVVDSLAAQGLTNTKLFSMNLGRQVSPGAVITGEMTFGGVDTNSYAGMLHKVPTDPSDPHYKITLSALAHRAPGAESSTPLSDSSLPLPLIVDSGTTLSLLPEPLVSKLAAQFPGAKSDGAGGYRVDCAYQNQTGTVDFVILAATGTVTINVAYRDFIWNSGGDCFLGAWFSNNVGTFILGDSFLRGAYVAFDQTNNALFISNRLSCGDEQLNLVAVPAGPDAAANIPGSCATVADPPPAPPSTLASSPILPAGTVSSTAILPVASTLGPSLNPIEPASTITITLSIPSSSGSLPPSPPGTSSLVATSTPSTISQPTPTSSSDVSPLSSINTGGLGPSGGGPSITQSPATGVGADLNAPGHTSTVTGTITRTVVYTVTACPETVRDCPFRDKVATRYETILTTYCPDHDEIPSLTAVGGVTFAKEPSAPPAVTPPIIEIETEIPPIVEISTPAAIKTGYAGSSDGQEHGVDEEQEQMTVITAAYPKTTTYAITSCGPADAVFCSSGMTTTRAITTTVVKTVHVAPVPSSVPPGNGFVPAATGSNNNKLPWNNTAGGHAAAAISAADDSISGTRYLAAMLMLVCGVVAVL